jgi:EpsD family peptidyl-prolyl cis-trans isomerase
MKLSSKTAASILITTFILSLSACGQHSDKVAATQVAAKVDGEEISVHQINQVLATTNTAGATTQAVQGMSRDVLEKLIDQQLAIEQANEKKISRTPEVIAQIEASKRDILARAYLQQLISTLPKPTPEEVKKYYSDHPQLFSERRIFNFQELTVPVREGLAEQLDAIANSGKSMDDVVTWLKSHDDKFSGGGATKAAEQLPMDLLGKMQTLKDGQNLVIKNSQVITLIHLASSKYVPIDEASAAPRIAQFIANQRASEAVSTNMKALRKAAKVEYLGDFAKDPATVAAAAEAAASAAKAETQPKSSLEKGVAGLK